ncbi:Transmembrane 9 superfamily member [Meloidogyne graminicola]|uniref:Transmembrane 9 superfamily member n=1 Tax=Meloidogyne graminicola TaxID=189291 RepID=A0A8T0A3A9_9BILA|nr:Transmembrane 9 superfamily member [Meloidogyne graminicola]
MLNIFILLFFSSFIVQNQSDEHNHIYKDGDEVVLWMNTVGPYSNRQETYNYYSLPFCKGNKKSIDHYHETLGEALLGVDLQFSGLDINFRKELKKTTICTRKLTRDDADAFVFAVEHNYWYQMYIDELPIWALVGEKESGTSFIYTHKKFEIGYNGDNIVVVDVTAEEKKEIQQDVELSFTYEVIWKQSNVEFDKRFERYLDPSFFQHRVKFGMVIHWFSIFNSFMMVIFLVGLVWMILLRTLNKDYARYHKEDKDPEEDLDLPDDYGWKQVHGDVFRAPAYPLLFSSIIGTGYHLITTVLITIMLAILSEFYTERGSLLSAAIFVYAITTPINGCFGGGMYSRVGGKRWIKQMLVGALLLPGVVAAMALGVNAVAIGYHASRAIPFTTMLFLLEISCFIPCKKFLTGNWLVIVCICAFVIIPLNLIGTLIGRSVKGQADIPCRINVVPRPIPDKKWYLEPLIIAAISGFLPFGSIFIEMYFVFTSFWAYKIYYVYGFMLLVAIILIIVTACVSIVSTYFLLNAEDYRWFEMDKLRFRSFSCPIRLQLCLLLLFLQNKNVRIIPDNILLCLHAHFLLSFGSFVRYSWLCFER